MSFVPHLGRVFFFEFDKSIYLALRATLIGDNVGKGILRLSKR